MDAAARSAPTVALSLHMEIAAVLSGSLPRGTLALKAWRSRHPEFDGVSIADEDGNLKLKV